MVKKFLKDLPKLPLSAFVFYSIILILRQLAIIPSPSEIIIILEGLLDTYGLAVVFISVFIEGIVYLGLYFPGTTLLTISILLSSGGFYSFLSIALTASLALTIASVLNYSLGRRLSHKFSPSTSEIKKTLSKGLLLSIIHPNTLSFYFFDSGIKKRNPLKIIFVPILITVYGLIVAFIIYSFKSVFKAAVENPFILLCFIFIWLVVAYLYDRKKKKHEINIP